ncbi:MAG TPA: ABC transporter ATP-binding protein [Anaerolineales bacterium]|nr:ABC transporter ATP-binding protein [Anaerolineales bacterium]
MTALRKLFPFIFPYRAAALIALALLLTQTFTDLAIPRLIQRIVDEGIRQNNLAVVLETAALMLGATALSTIFALGNNRSSVLVGEGMARDLRDALFVKTQAFAYGDLDTFTTGNLLVRLASDTTAVQRVFQISLRIGTRAPLMMLGSLALMFMTSRELSLTLLPLLIVTSAVIVFFSARMEPLFWSVQLKLDRLNTVLQENLAGARLVKAFVRDTHESRRFAIANADYTQRNVEVMQFLSMLPPVLTLFVNIGMVVVVYFGGLRGIAGELTVGQIMAFYNYLLNTLNPLILTGLLANTWANGIASARRINEVLDHIPEVQDRPGAGDLPEPVRGRVTFSGVAFRYRSADADVDEQDVLSDISLDVVPGQTLAILGATGAGKTSLINLIPRFYDVTAGSVSVDGVDVRDVRQAALVAHVALVPQEAILFTGTVRDNIRFARPTASDAEVEAAARAAQAQDFILKLPAGYDTSVAERGVNLSGGQKQRIAIARAFLADSAILILDDSTSAVDVETEGRIQAALRERRAGRTTVIVAQRISSALSADQIVVLDRGRLAAQGSHADLLERSPIYQEIYESQLGAGVREVLDAEDGGRP